MSNYAMDRSTDFRNTGADGLLPEGLNAWDYRDLEKNKQYNRMRDWHLEAKNQQIGESNSRANFATSRSFAAPNPVQNLQKHKMIFAGVMIAMVSAAGVVFMFTSTLAH